MSREGKLTAFIIILRPRGKKVNQLAYLWFYRAGKCCQLHGSQRKGTAKKIWPRSQRVFLVKWDLGDNVAREFC